MRSSPRRPATTPRCSPPEAPRKTCAFFGAVERPGTYTVTAEAGGVTGTVSGVKVRSDECHVITEKVTVKLGA